MRAGRAAGRCARHVDGRAARGLPDGHDARARAPTFLGRAAAPCGFLLLRSLRSTRLGAVTQGVTQRVESMTRAEFESARIAINELYPKGCLSEPPNRT